MLPLLRGHEVYKKMNISLITKKKYLKYYNCVRMYVCHYDGSFR